LLYKDATGRIATRLGEKLSECQQQALAKVETYSDSLPANPALNSGKRLRANSSGGS